MLSKFTCGNLKEVDHLEDLGPHRRTKLKLLLQKYSGNARTGLIWLRLGANVGVL